MFRVFADDHNFSVSLDDLALVAHGLDGRTYFHFLVLLTKSFYKRFFLDTRYFSPDSSVSGEPRRSAALSASSSA